MCLKPKTAANLEERMQVVDLLRDNEPAVSWQPLRGILPTNRNISYGISSPEHREWTEGSESTVSWDEVFAATDEALDRLLQDVGVDASRWADLVGTYEYLPKPEQRDAVSEKLLTVDASDI